MEKTEKAYKIKAFGVAREIMGGREVLVECQGQTVATLKQALEQRFPSLLALRSYFIAVNNVYAADSTEIQLSDEIAIIPPVSGG